MQEYVATSDSSVDPRVVARSLLWPLLTLLFVALYIWIANTVDAHRYMESASGLLGLSLAFIGIWLVLERWLPFRPEWNRMGRQEANDILHYGAGIALPEELVRAGLYASVPLVALVVPTG